MGLTLTLWLALIAASPAPLDIAAYAKQLFGSGAGPIAVSAPFAVVNYVYDIEGTRAHGQTLFRHYRFGWQMIALTGGYFRRCDLRSAGVPAAAIPALSVHDRGLPDPYWNVPCDAPRPFALPSADEEAIRAVLHQRVYVQFYATVAADHGFGLITWGNPGGGQMIARKVAGHWEIVRGSGGMNNACWIMEYGGAPAPVAHRLIVDVFGDTPAMRNFARTDGCVSGSRTATKVYD